MCGSPTGTPSGCMAPPGTSPRFCSIGCERWDLPLHDEGDLAVHLVEGEVAVLVDVGVAADHLDATDAANGLRRCLHAGSLVGDVDGHRTAGLPYGDGDGALAVHGGVVHEDSEDLPDRGGRRVRVRGARVDPPLEVVAGLSLYAILRRLQALVATCNGVCAVCGQIIDVRPRAPTQRRIARPVAQNGPKRAELLALPKRLLVA